MKTFSIVANVAFEIPKFLVGSFNAYHTAKGRLVKTGNIGKITEEGVKFFTAREGEKPTAKTYAAFLEASKTNKYPVAEKQGIQWPVGNQGIAYQSGSGTLGQSAFFYALCELTNKPAKKATASVQKAPTIEAKQKASVTPKPASVKPAKSVTKATVTA